MKYLGTIDENLDLVNKQYVDGGSGGAVADVSTIMDANSSYVIYDRHEIANAGSGYAVDDIVYALKNTSTVRFKVTEVDGSGQLVGIQYNPLTQNESFAIANDPAGNGLGLYNIVSSGSGASINLHTRYAPGDYITLGELQYVSDKDPLVQRTLLENRITSVADSANVNTSRYFRYSYGDGSWSSYNNGNIADLSVGEYQWDASTNVLRIQEGYHGPTNYGDYRDCIIFVQGSILGGSAGYVTGGGSRLGVRYIVAWSSGETDWGDPATKDHPGQGALQIYMTTNKYDDSYASSDRIITTGTVASMISSGGSGMIGRGIIMWYGSVSSIPEGYVLCDGTQGTPNLMDKVLYFHNPVTDTGPTLSSGSGTVATACLLPLMRVDEANSIIVVDDVQDGAVEVLEGSPLVLEYLVEGVEPITYQWYKNGSAIPGATANTYTIPSVSEDDVGDEYYCIATNPYTTTQSGTTTIALQPGVIYTLDMNGGTAIGGDSSGVKNVSDTITLPSGASKED